MSEPVEIVTLALFPGPATWRVEVPLVEIGFQASQNVRDCPANPNLVPVWKDSRGTGQETLEFVVEGVVTFANRELLGCGSTCPPTESRQPTQPPVKSLGNKGWIAEKEFVSAVSPQGDRHVLASELA